MDQLNEYRKILHQVLSGYIPLMTKPDRTSTLIVSEDYNHCLATIK
jgi:hypothetical protein